MTGAVWRSRGKANRGGGEVRAWTGKTREGESRTPRGWGKARWGGGELRGKPGGAAPGTPPKFIFETRKKRGKKNSERRADQGRGGRHGGAGAGF